MSVWRLGERGLRGHVTTKRRLGERLLIAGATTLAAVGIADVAAAAGKPLVASCGQVIGARANLVLQNDLGPCGTDAIVITADDVTLDLNGHTLKGQPRVTDADGNVTAGTGEGAGIRIVGTRGVVVTDSKHGTAGAGSISDFDAGVAILPSDAGTKSTFNTVMNLTVTGNIGNVIDGAADDPLISKFSAGIYVVTAERNTIKNNVVTDNSFWGVGLDDGANFNLVSGNQIDANRGGGFQLVTSTRGNVVASNTMKNNRFGGIGTSFDNFDSVFRNNVVDSNGAFGIIVGPLSGAMTIAGNTVTNNKFAGIVITSDSHVVGNTVSSNGLTAPATGFLACEPAGIVKCDGIFVPGGDLPDSAQGNNTIEENVVTNNKNNGISINCTRDDSLGTDTPPCSADFNQNNRVRGNKASGNGTGTQVTCDPGSCLFVFLPFWKGFVFGSFDLLDGNNAVNRAASTPAGTGADCGHNVWSDNAAKGGTTGFPACTRKG